MRDTLRSLTSACARRTCLARIVLQHSAVLLTISLQRYSVLYSCCEIFNTVPDLLLSFKCQCLSRIIRIYNVVFQLRSCWDRNTPSLLTGGHSGCCCMKCWLVSRLSTEMMKMSCSSPSAWTLPTILAGSARRPRTCLSGSVPQLLYKIQYICHRVPFLPENLVSMFDYFMV